MKQKGQESLQTEKKIRPYGITYFGDLKTQQHFKQEVNINEIVARFTSQGVLPQIPGAIYGDFSEMGSYQDAMNLIREADEMFMALSSKVRERFGHDPKKLIAFCEDKSNREEAIKLGLIPKPAVVPAGKVS